MKKLFNYALLAAALLVGVNVNAENEVSLSIAGGAATEYAKFTDALKAICEAAKDNGTELSTEATITLLTDVAEFGYETWMTDFVQEVGKDDRIKLNRGEYITIDLAGKTLTTKLRFNIYRAGIILTGAEGSKFNTDMTQVFTIYGAGNKTASTGASKFVLDKNVVLTNNATGKINSVYCFGCLGQSNNNYSGIQFDIYGTVIANQDGCTAFATNGSYTYNEPGFYIPQVHFYPGSEVYASNNLTLSTELGAKAADITAVGEDPATHMTSASAIYAPGVANIIVEGLVEGGVGIYMKAGSVTITGEAKVRATAEKYYKPVKYGNGFYGAGSAIVVDSHDGYGELEGIEISGSAVVSSDHGYGIEETATTGESKVPDIVVESGTISGGEGSIATTVDVKDNVVLSGTITGGNFSDTKITEYISNVEGVITPITDEDGNTSYTVTPMEGGKEVAEARDLATAAATDDVMLKADKELTADAQCKNLVVEKDATLTIEKKLTVYGTLTIQGKVVVKAGATLIVEGNGITCLDASKFVIESAQNSPAQFYLNPEATGNFHPKATVDYYTEAINLSNWDRIGVPAYNGMKVKDIVRNCGIQMFVFDNASGWVEITSVETQLNPFQGLTIRTNATEPTTLKFPCELVGNANADLKFYPKWNTFSNSYTAKADLTAFIREQFEAGEAALLEATIHKYDATNPNAVWEPVTLMDLDEGEKDGVLKPMQAIVIRNKTTQNGNIALSYNDNVWVCRQQAPAGAPKLVQSNVNKAVINLTSVNGLTDKLTIREAAQFTEQFDNGADATKYPNSIFNMYVATEFGDLCQLASNNVEGQVITLATTNETEFTMSFSNVRGEKMALVDNMTGDVIEMVEGNVYNFFANANEVSERFTVVAAAQAPTALKNAENKAKAAKFINNGQIVLQNNGRMFNVLGSELK